MSFMIFMVTPLPFHNQIRRPFEENRPPADSNHRPTTNNHPERSEPVLNVELETARIAVSIPSKAGLCFRAVAGLINFRFHKEK